MADVPVLLAFNRGVISVLGLARVDLNRTALSASIQTNFMPRTLGPMMLRAGTQYTISTDSNNKAKTLPFVFSNTDKARLEFTDSKLRPLVDDDVVTRASVSTSVTNGSFTSNVTSWTDNDESGATSAWVTGGYLGLTGNGTAAAIREQQLTVSGGDQNTEHALDIVIERGPVTLRVGSTSGDDDYISEQTLLTGVHSLAFTPTGSAVYVELSSRVDRQVLVDSVAIASSGTLELTSPYAEADLFNIRYTQSADVVFLACDGYQQRRVERRGTRSWSLVLYQSENGPFRLRNVGPTTISASAITGNVTLTASTALFQSTHVGALFRMVSSGQRVEADISAENNFSSSIRVTGTGSSRAFNIERAGTWTATAVLQRSIGEEGNWEDVSGKTYTTNGTETAYNDGLDNQIVYYRIGVKTGAYTSGTVELALDYALGSITGVARVTSVASATSASAEVLVALGSTSATDNWSEGSWSDYRGWPSAVVLYEGRLWWFGKDNIWGSVSDAFANFDPDTEGDSGPVNRSIGEGPVDTLNWALPLLRLVIGGDAAEYTIKSSSFDEPLTPSDFNIKAPSTQGSAQVNAIKVDSGGVFVQAGGTRVYGLDYDGATLDYVSTDRTAIAPEIGEPSITVLAVQRQPDTRIHCVRSDGVVAVLVYDRAEEVQAWIPIQTPGGDGIVEDVCVLPGTEEDEIFYTVKRTVEGGTVRYHEKWSLERECRGQTFSYDGASTTLVEELPYRSGTKVTVFDADGEKVENLTVSSSKTVTLTTAATEFTINPSVLKCADSHITFSQSASATVSGLGHLEGLDVVVFADGVALEDADGNIATFTVSSGSITLTHRGSAFLVEEGCVGLAYQSRFKSSKLAYAAQVGTALTQSGKVTRIGFILTETHAKGIKFGQNFETMEEMPDIEDGVQVNRNHLWPEYDKKTTIFPGTYDSDTRICIEANAPRPATVAAIPFVIQKHSQV